MKFILTSGFMKADEERGVDIPPKYTSIFKGVNSKEDNLIDIPLEENKELER